MSRMLSIASGVGWTVRPRTCPMLRSSCRVHIGAGIDAARRQLQDALHVVRRSKVELHVYLARAVGAEHRNGRSRQLWKSSRMGQVERIRDG